MSRNMNAIIVDRRNQGGKSHGNRERFLRRYKGQIKEAVRRSIDGRDIKDIGQSEEIRIPKKDINEPVFQHGQGGARDVVHPGNKQYNAGDRIKRPDGGGGKGGGNQASNTGEGQDDFTFTLTKAEFMELFFEDLALPNLARTTLADTPEFKRHRAGYTTDGTPTNLALVPSWKQKLGRRLGTGIPRQIRDIEEQLGLVEALWAGRKSELPEGSDGYLWLFAEFERVTGQYRDQLAQLRARLSKIPGLDPLDLRYRTSQKIPQPYAKAVMFCLMDISGSMDEDRKNLAKRFFILLYLFLTRHYEKIDIVFIRHHTQAQEVTEEEFFHSTETGGTVVSSALNEMMSIVRARYPSSEWNIYGAQASDGDNWHNDSDLCRQILLEEILPVCRYFAYIQVVTQEQNLWEEYLAVKHACKHFAMKKVSKPGEIYPVFRELFEKEKS